MRIISGTHKSRRINPPKGLPVRPTTDLSKEALFNILTNRFDFEELTICDLFAGTGSISFEFASRGVKNIISVDKNYRCTEFISSKSKELGFTNIEVIKNDVFRFILQYHSSFDLVFADPPYDLDDFDTIPETVLQSKIIKPTTTFILEHSGKSKFNDLEYCSETRRYGNVNFSFFKPTN